LDMVHGDLKAVSSRQAGDDNFEPKFCSRRMFLSMETVEHV
jgi:hypothetical protein